PRNRPTPWDRDRAWAPPAPPGAAARRPHPPRQAPAAGRSDSTRSRRRSPAPSRHAARPKRSGGHAALVSGISRIGAGAPVFGPLPADAEAQHGLAAGLPAHP